MVNESQSKGLKAWFYKRLPVKEFIETQATGYYAPKNFNIWYFFGFIAMVVLVMQLLTGIFLTMFYKPGEATSFDSVEFIMREVDYGWLIRYLHSTGASAFFFVVYLHMFRAIMYGSYRAPRELLWLFGMLIYLALMAEAFMGYVLPWGNMSYWAANVIVNIFGTIPVIGSTLVEWIRGDFGIADSTLNRFFALHVVAVPAGAAAAGGAAPGGAAPDRLEQSRMALKSKPTWGRRPPGRRHPVPSVLLGEGFVRHFGVPGDLRVGRVFRTTMGGLLLEHANFEPTNIYSTPNPITPSWYFTPYYAILRAVPDQRMGALLMALSLVCFLLLPWLDRSPVKSIRYKGPLSRAFLGSVRRVLPGPHVSGLQEPAGIYVTLGRLAHRRLLRVFHTDAVLHPYGTVQAGARSREV